MSKKRVKSRWERKLDLTLTQLEKKGHKVHFVTSKVLKDYGGMNYAAAQEMRFSWPKNVPKCDYLISATSEPSVQCKDSIHENSEYEDMTKKKMKYWPAHCRALQKEKSVRC